jgi:DNA helicase-2/ATP-dependent DNA helicase PcrA
MDEAAAQGQTLEDVLDSAALVAGADEYDETIPVSLMTLHSAKGLEFDAVYLAGLEEGLFPHSRSFNSTGELEEERRLFYVGMTRARRSLLLSRAIYRRSYGEERLRASIPSRFIGEIPGDLIEAAAGSSSDPGQSRRYEPDPEFSEGNAYRQRRRASYGYPPRQARSSATPVPPRSSSNPLIGARVRHAKYGVGTIIDIEGEDEDRKLTVSFQDYGPKKLIERYANLQFA